MLKINQIKLPVGQNEQHLEKKIRKILNLPKTESFTYEIIKKSLDARKKPELFYVYTVHVTVHNESKVKKKIHPSSVSVVTESEYQFPVAGKENEVTPVARQVAEQVMHASEAEASVVHRLQNQLTK